MYTAVEQYITPKRIEMGYPAKDKTDAIREAGRLLLEDDIIEERFIDAMIDTCEKLDAYIVLVPGVALPHARPDEGAKKVGVSLVQLLHPVEFGHPENDPVRLVMAISSPDNKSHLSTLKMVSAFIMNEELVKKASVAKDTEEMMRLLDECIGEKKNV